MDSKQSLGELNTHNGWVEMVAFSPDGKTFASGSYDHTIQIWDVDYQKEGEIEFEESSKINYTLKAVFSKHGVLNTKNLSLNIEKYPHLKKLITKDE
uniref:Uncharacterized protein n=1 Tax=Arcella intermedia TaxID=1963864 RepID=A0A6B2LN07_9EUKA